MKSNPLPSLGYVGAAFFLLTLLSCEKSGEYQVGETRELTTVDEPVRLEVTSADRFEPPKTTPEAPLSMADSAPNSGASRNETFTYLTPEGWTEQEPTMFRAVNMSFSPQGEAYVSKVGGDLLGNLNRWYGQFGLPPIEQKDLAQLEKITLAGHPGYLITASGTFNAGMGRPAKEGVTLLAAIAQGDDQLITVKLTAPHSSAQAQKEAFYAFCRSLQHQTP